MTGLRLWTGAFAFNAILAFALQAAAPAQPANTDRQEYEYNGQHPFAGSCPWTVYCYRVLVPVLLEQIPVESEPRWRWFQVSANTVAGTLVSITTAAMTNGLPGAAIAAILVQSSYGFAFTAYDPYTADPLVFVFSATLAWCWLANRWQLALAVGLIGIFAKETVALVSAATALAALVDRQRAGWTRWLMQGVLVVASLLAFHWVMDTYFGWGISSNPAAQFSGGSWIARWWANNPGLLRKSFFLFAPFGFGWLYCAAGVGRAPRDLRRLALGAVLPFLALNYVQNPECALGNLFFVVVPLATITLSRVPFGVALAAAITTGALTAKVGSSTTWLPSSTYLLPVATVAAAAVFWSLRQRSGMDDRQPE